MFNVLNGIILIIIMSFVITTCFMVMSINNSIKNINTNIIKDNENLTKSLNKLETIIVARISGV